MVAVDARKEGWSEERQDGRGGDGAAATGPFRRRRGTVPVIDNDDEDGDSGVDREEDYCDDGGDGCSLLW